MVMDVAGTILMMYRVAKDIGRGVLLEKVVTWELIMEKKDRALVVPQIDPDLILSSRPDELLGDTGPGPGRERGDKLFQQSRLER